MGASQKKRMQTLSSHFRRQEAGLYRKLSNAIVYKALALKNQANGSY